MAKAPPSAFQRSKSWLEERISPTTTSKAKLVLTGDLFNTKQTKQPLQDTLREFLAYKGDAKALWIHDARAGWHPTAVARAWMMDGFAI